MKAESGKADLFLRRVPPNLPFKKINKVVRMSKIIGWIPGFQWEKSLKHTFGKCFHLMEVLILCRIS